VSKHSETVDVHVLILTMKIVFHSFLLLLLLIIISIYANNDDSETVPTPPTSSWLTTNITTFISWVQSAGTKGIIGYTIFFALGVTFCLPCTPLEMLPGFLFGFKIGLGVAIVGKNCGNLIQVLLARYVLRNWAQQNVINKYENCQIAQQMINRGGFKSLFLFRSVSFPLYVKNFGLGAMDLSLKNIMAACFLSGLPFACVWTFLGCKSKNLLDILNGNKPSLGMPNWINYVVPLILVPLIYILYQHIKSEWEIAKKELVQLKIAKKKDNNNNESEMLIRKKVVENIDSSSSKKES